MRFNDIRPYKSTPILGRIFALTPTKLAESHLTGRLQLNVEFIWPNFSRIYLTWDFFSAIIRLGTT